VKAAEAVKGVVTQLEAQLKDLKDKQPRQEEVLRFIY
jgi:hypothetical protein